MGFAPFSKKLLDRVTPKQLDRDLVSDAIRSGINRAKDLSPQDINPVTLMNAVGPGLVNAVTPGGIPDLPMIPNPIQKAGDMVGIPTIADIFSAVRHPVRTGEGVVDAVSGAVGSPQAIPGDVFDYFRGKVGGAPGQAVDLGEGVGAVGTAAQHWWEGEEAAVGEFLASPGFKTGLGVLGQTLAAIEVPLNAMKENYGESMYQIALTRGKKNEFGHVVDTGLFTLFGNQGGQPFANNPNDARLAEFVQNNPKIWPAIIHAYEEGGGRAVWELIIGLQEKRLRIGLEIALDPLTYAAAGGPIAKAIRGPSAIADMSKGRQAAYRGAQIVGGVETAQDAALMGALKVGNKATFGVVPKATGKAVRGVARVPYVQKSGQKIAQLFEPSERQLMEDRNAFTQSMISRYLGAGTGAPGAIDRFNSDYFNRLVSAVSARQKAAPLFRKEAEEVRKWLDEVWGPWLEARLGGDMVAPMPAPPNLTMLKISDEDLERIIKIVDGADDLKPPTPVFRKPDNFDQIQKLADDVGANSDLDELFKRLSPDQQGLSVDDFPPGFAEANKDMRIDRLPPEQIGRLIEAERARLRGEGLGEDSAFLRKLNEQALIASGELGGETDVRALIGGTGVGAELLDRLSIEDMSKLREYADELQAGNFNANVPRFTTYEGVFKDQEDLLMQIHALVGDVRFNSLIEAEVPGLRDRLLNRTNSFMRIKANDTANRDQSIRGIAEDIMALNPNDELARELQAKARKLSQLHESRRLTRDETSRLVKAVVEATISRKNRLDSASDIPSRTTGAPSRISYQPNQDIFNSPAELIINPTNLSEIANAGLARQFNQRFPEITRLRQEAVRDGRINKNSGTELVAGGQKIWDLPTKIHYSNATSDLSMIDRQLASLATHIKQTGIKSVAIPKIGTGLGRLDWGQVRGLIEKHLGNLDGVDVRVLGEGPVGGKSATGAPAVVIAGSRSKYWSNVEQAKKQVEAYVNSLPEGTVVYSGMADGVDRWAYDAAVRRGLPVREFPADWSLGRGAGMIRNRQMADAVKEAGGKVKVFQAGNSPGSRNMIDYSRSIGVLDDELNAKAPTGNTPTVVNSRTQKPSPKSTDVYVGRPSSSVNSDVEGADGYFGNPFRISDNVTREESVAKFEDYARNRIAKDPEYARRVKDLQGKRLYCWCYPQPCHGDVLAKLSDELNAKAPTGSTTGPVAHAAFSVANAVSGTDFGRLYKQLSEIDRTRLDRYAESVQSRWTANDPGLKSIQPGEARALVDFITRKAREQRILNRTGRMPTGTVPGLIDESKFKRTVINEQLPPEPPREEGVFTPGDDGVYDRGYSGDPANPTPEPAPGFTRLYRGETDPSGYGQAPSWLKDQFAISGKTNATGRWFSEDPHRVEFYLDFQSKAEPGKPRDPVRITYIDVPTSQLEQYRVANLPDEMEELADLNGQQIGVTLRPKSKPAPGMEHHEFFVTREMADARQEFNGPWDQRSIQAEDARLPMDDMDPSFAATETPAPIKVAKGKWQVEGHDQTFKTKKAAQQWIDENMAPGQSVPETIKDTPQTVDEAIFQTEDRAFVRNWNLLTDPEKATIREWYVGQITQKINNPVPRNLPTLDSGERQEFFSDLAQLAEDARINIEQSIKAIYGDVDELPTIADAMFGIPRQFNQLREQSALHDIYAADIDDWYRLIDSLTAAGQDIEQSIAQFPFPAAPQGYRNPVQPDMKWLSRRTDLLPTFEGVGPGAHLQQWDSWVEDIDLRQPNQIFMKPGNIVDEDYVPGWANEPYIDKSVTPENDIGGNNLARDFPMETLLVNHRTLDRISMHYETRFNVVKRVDRAILDAQFLEARIDAYAKFGVDARPYWKERGNVEFDPNSDEGLLQKVIHSRKLADAQKEIDELKRRGLIREGGGTRPGEIAAEQRWREVQRIHKKLRRKPQMGPRLQPGFVEFAEGETAIRLERVRGEKGRSEWYPLDQTGARIVQDNGKEISFGKKVEAMRYLDDTSRVESEITAADFRDFSTEELERTITDAIDGDGTTFAKIQESLPSMWQELALREDKTLDIPWNYRAESPLFPEDMGQSEIWNSYVGGFYQNTVEGKEFWDQMARERLNETPVERSARLPFQVLGRSFLAAYPEAQVHSLIDLLQAGVRDLNRLGYSPPQTLTISDKGTTGPLMSMAADSTMSILHVNMAKLDRILDPKRINDAATTRYKLDNPSLPKQVRWFSSDHPNHFFYHEAMHQRHAAYTKHYGSKLLRGNGVSDPNAEVDWLDFMWALPDSENMSYATIKRDIALEVSGRAAVSPMEFVAEVAAGYIAGKRYPRWVMQTYDAFYGPALTPSSGPAVNSSPRASLSPVPGARSIEEIAIGGPEPPVTPEDLHITAQLLGERGRHIDFTTKSNDELNWWLGGKFNMNPALSARPSAPNMGLRMYQATGIDNLVRLMHEHAFIDNELAAWLVRDSGIEGGVQRTNGDVIMHAFANTYNPVEARTRAMNMLAEVAPDPVGYRKAIAPFLKVFDRATNMMREAMLMNFARGVAAMFTDYGSSTYLSIISGNADATAQMADYRQVINSAAVMMGKKQGAPVHQVVELSEDAWGISPGEGVIQMVNRDLVSGIGQSAWADTIDDLFRRGPNWIANKLSDSEEAIEIVGKEARPIKVLKKASQLVSTDIIRSARHAGDIHVRATLWWTRFNGEIAPLQDDFYELVKRRAENLKVSKQTSDSWINKLKAERPGGTFHADDVHRITGDTALAQDWAGKLNTANKAATKEVNRVYFSYKMTNIDEGMRRMFLFHYWQTRAVAFHANLTLRNPALLTTYFKAWEGMNRDNQEAGLPPTEQAFWNFLSTQAYDGLLDPLTIIVPMTMFREWGNVEGQDETFIDRSLDRLGLFLNPMFQAGLTSWGFSTQRSDAIGMGTASLRTMVVKQMNMMRNNGMLPGFDPGLTPDPIGIVEARMLEMFNSIGSRVNPFGKDMKEVNWKASSRDDINEIIMHQAELEWGPYGSMTPEQQVEIWNAQSALLLEDYSNERTMRAMRDYSNVEFIERSGRMVIPGNINFIYEPEERRDMAQDAYWNTVEAGGIPNESMVSGMMSGQQTSAGSVEAIFTTGQKNVQDNIGGVNRERIFDRVVEIKQGRVKDPISIGGMPLSPRIVNGLPPDKRAELADSWLDEDPARRTAYEQVGALREDYLSGAPELAQYRSYQDTIDEMGGGRVARTAFRRAIPQFARREKEQRDKLIREEGLEGEELEGRLDSWVLSTDAYLAVLGAKENLRSQPPLESPSIIGFPTSGGSGSGTGAPSAPSDQSGPGGKLRTELAAYLNGTGPETQAVNRYLRWQVKLQRLAPGRSTTVDDYLQATNQVSTVLNGN